MDRRIVGFHQDSELHWVTELACGHTQHVRHDPPWKKTLLLLALLVPGCRHETAPEPAAITDLIELRTPLPNTILESPLTIEGKARGPWFFEASFPVYLVDADGDTIAVKPATAEGEWMTREFVPFKTTLTFTAPTSRTGTLILTKDNPSGLPEHAAELRVPIRFR